MGYVPMPEHFHVLLWPSELANPSQVMQKLEKRTAKFILRKASARRRSRRGAKGCCGRSRSLSRCITTLTVGCGSGDFMI